MAGNGVSTNTTSSSSAPSTSTTKEKRDKVIRIRSYNHERLARLETIADDFDDALTKVLDYWEKNAADSGGGGSGGLK